MKGGGGGRLLIHWPIALTALFGAGAFGVLVDDLAFHPEHHAVAAHEHDGGVALSCSEQSSPVHDAPGYDGVVVRFTPEMRARAAIEASAVEATSSSAAIRIPAVIEPNAYARAVVTAPADGRLTRVQAQLGDSVEAGQVLARVHSPAFAAAQAEYLTLRTRLGDMTAREQRLARLSHLGAVSGEEHDQLRLDTAAMRAEVESLRGRLALFGMTPESSEQLTAPDRINPIVEIRAPIAGIITARDANIGVSVSASTPLFTIVDLATVWAIGNVYEVDLGSVQVGRPVAVTVTAFPDSTMRGVVGYIDPQIDPATRTAKIRIELPNPHLRLRLGMYADVTVDRRGRAGTPVVNRSAVQTVGDREVVYVVRGEGQYVERAVRLGAAIGDQVQVIDGLAPGEVVVTKGSFFVRSAWEQASVAR